MNSASRCLWLGALGSAFVLAAPAQALELITTEEAKLPAAPRIETRGGITRGPTIKIVSPAPESQVKGPFNMKVDFQPHGGSKIQPSTVKVIYLTKPNVDLTPRLKTSISENGIEASGVQVPPGTHNLKVDVSDSEGRTKSGVVTFTVKD